ncbi:MAG: hypothetical protein JKY67_07960 [Pseudomonadales bacterium]|nr:hypothetical protein [Pseudomonadales bacterium]
MSDQQYQIVFTGQIIEGADLAEVKRKIAKLFNASEKQLAMFFSGKRVVIKNKVDKETAKKYQTALNKAGAQCVLEIMKVAPVSRKRPAAKAPVVESAQAGSMRVEPVGANLGVKSAEVPPSAPDVSHISVSTAGATLGEENKQPAPPAPDVSHISVSAAGAILGVENKDPAPPAPDVSHISVAEAGVVLVDSIKKPTPTVPDVSSMSITPLGSDMSDHSDEDATEAPDVSHLSLK